METKSFNFAPCFRASSIYTTYTTKRLLNYLNLQKLQTIIPRSIV